MIQIPDWQSWCLLRYWAVVLVLGCEFSIIFLQFLGSVFAFWHYWGLMWGPRHLTLTLCSFSGRALYWFALRDLAIFWMSARFWSWIRPSKKIKDFWMGLTQKPYVIWPITQWPGFCLGWIRWKSACPKPSSTLTASLLVLIFPHAALVLIETAIRRRHLDYLTSSGCFKHSFPFQNQKPKVWKAPAIDRYGIQLAWLTGRACDISKASRELLGLRLLRTKMFHKCCG